MSQDWANGPSKGSSPSWPVGVGGKGNEGVAGLVRQLPGAIGYVELIYALQNKMTFGAVEERGRQLDHRVHCRCYKKLGASVKQMPADYRVSITNAPGANAYPIRELHISTDSQ